MSNRVPRWAQGMGFNLTFLFAAVKLIGWVTGTGWLDSIPLWSWNPFELSILFLYNWTIWLLGIAQFLKRTLQVPDCDDNQGSS